MTRGTSSGRSALGWTQKRLASRRSGWHRNAARHFSAQQSGAAAGFRAGADLTIVSEQVAGVGATLGHLSAQDAQGQRKVRSAQHEVCGGLADLSAIKQQAKV